ncbi:MAG TPA: FHA domain-containing protein, partial [Ktedonobacterales bacterium]
SANTPQTDDRNGQDDLDDADEHDADEHDADEHDAERERQRILIDISLDGSVSSDPGEEVAHSIDMTRARGLLWRAQLQRALGLGEPGTETSEIPAVSPSEVLSLVRARAQSRPLLPTGDDEVVSVALADRSADAGSARRTSYLVMLQGNNPGRIYPLQNDRMTLGRSRDSDLFLEDLAVSRHHAALVRDTTGRFVLYDENSKNGTFVNGQSVTERVLEDGDSIRLGQCVLQFRRPRNND